MPELTALNKRPKNSKQKRIGIKASTVIAAIKHTLVNIALHSAGILPGTRFIKTAEKPRLDIALKTTIMARSFE